MALGKIRSAIEAASEPVRLIDGNLNVATARLVMRDLRQSLATHAVVMVTQRNACSEPGDIRLCLDGGFRQRENDALNAACHATSHKSMANASK